ncbi:MAG: glucosyl-3-phosphoglycerate synthase [Micromonosporaceae bacterium]|nr:glucosyl-3-phosphoglycerate synthase [Micromonosporaceae bacterium]
MHPTANQWYADRTSRSEDWPADLLRARKHGTPISVVLPALNEEATVGGIVEQIRDFADRTGLVDEIVVMDSGSVDRTAEAAAEAGAAVCHRDHVLSDHGSRPGKGEVLWKSLACTKGDLLVYVDADLTEFGEHYLTGLIGPLLADPEVMLVKAFYDRPLNRGADGHAESTAGGGRVTELMARPLLNSFFPELAGVVQPLAGEYAGHRALLEQLPFAAGYGVEIAMLLDTVRLCGLDALAQVDLGYRAHKHQDTAALGRMSSTILHAVLRRVGRKGPVWTEFTQFQRDGADIVPADFEVTWPDRPPMASIPQYAEALAPPAYTL